VVRSFVTGIEEIVDELERAFLISPSVTLTSDNVVLEKVDLWETSTTERCKESRT
jgi:hypothetical protein